MNQLADARSRLATALEPIMPGRVGPYAPGAQITPPYVWLGEHTGRSERAGQNSTVLIATFPVWCAVNGADSAQFALLDDLVARVWDACEATANLSPRQWVPRDLPEHPRIRTAVVDVAVTITARTLCPPNVTAVLVPPEPVEVA